MCRKCAASSPTCGVLQHCGTDGERCAIGDPQDEYEADTQLKSADIKKLSIELAAETQMERDAKAELVNERQEETLLVEEVLHKAADDKFESDEDLKQHFTVAKLRLGQLISQGGTLAADEEAVHPDELPAEQSLDGQAAEERLSELSDNLEETKEENDTQRDANGSINGTINGNINELPAILKQADEAKEDDTRRVDVNATSTDPIASPEPIASAELIGNLNGSSEVKTVQPATADNGTAADALLSKVDVTGQADSLQQLAPANETAPVTNIMAEVSTVQQQITVNGTAPAPT